MNSGISSVLHTPLLEADVVREFVTTRTVRVITSYITLGLIALAFEERQMIPPTGLARVPGIQREIKYSIRNLLSVKIKNAKECIQRALMSIILLASSFNGVVFQCMKNPGEKLTPFSNILVSVVSFELLSFYLTGVLIFVIN